MEKKFLTYSCLQQVLEGCFAASNIMLVKRFFYMDVSGGVKSKSFLFMENKESLGLFIDTIVQGKNCSRNEAFFYDDKIGFIHSGDYENEIKIILIKTITSDGGKTWKLVAENNGF
jgi:hypothetical protein